MDEQPNAIREKDQTNQHKKGFCIGPTNFCIGPTNNPMNNPTNGLTRVCKDEMLSPIPKFSGQWALVIIHFSSIKNKQSVDIGVL